MESYVALSQELIQQLRLEQPPIAISFTDRPPEGVASYIGQAPAGCRFWQDAATSTFTTSARDHELCAIGVHTHNLQTSQAQQKDLTDALKVFADLGYVRPEDVPQIPVLTKAVAARHLLPPRRSTASSRRCYFVCPRGPDADPD